MAEMTPGEAFWLRQRKLFASLLPWAKLTDELRARYEREAIHGCECTMCRGPRQRELETASQHKRPEKRDGTMSEEEKDAKVLAAAKRLAKAYIKYGKELDTELDALAKAAMKRWPEMESM